LKDFVLEYISTFFLHASVAANFLCRIAPALMSLCDAGT
jgi:hypothetical protein